MNWRACVLAATALLLGGCAVQQTRPGQLGMGVDLAEVLGERLDGFKLADGSEGTLRRLNGAYSIKLQRSFTVVPIQQAQQVRLLSTEYFGDRTTVVMQKITSNCQHRLELLSIVGRDVSSWTFGDCNLPTRIQRDGDMLVFDQPTSNRPDRIVYQDDRLVRQRQSGSGTSTTMLGGRSVSGGAATGVTPSAQRSSSSRRGNEPAPVVGANAPRHQPQPPITQAAFQADLQSEPFMPDMPTANTPSRRRTDMADGSERPSREKGSGAPPPPPPSRPRALAGSTVEDLQPIRIKLD